MIASARAVPIPGRASSCSLLALLMSSRLACAIAGRVSVVSAGAASVRPSANSAARMSCRIGRLLWPHGRVNSGRALRRDRGGRSGLTRERLLDLGLQHAFEVGLGDRPDQFVGDVAVAPDQESLRHAVDAPFYRGAAITVGAGGSEWITVAAEEAARIVGLILVVDADQPDAAVRGKHVEQRRLVVARDAP